MARYDVACKRKQNNEITNEKITKSILLDKGDRMIVGYILVLVTILETGQVTGESIEYFDDPWACIEQGIWEEENSPPDIGYVCIEDYIDMEKLK